MTSFKASAMALSTALAIAAGGTQAMAADVIDQSQPASNGLLARFIQTDLAQSFQQSSGNISGAGFFLNDAAAGLGAATTFTVQLWSQLPNAGGSLLASGSAQDTGGGSRWVDVFWDPLTITPDSTYFLVFQETSGQFNFGIDGTIFDSYARGQAYANSGYQSFPGFDYTFRTFADDGVPEPATWAMLILGFGVVGAGMRARRRGLEDRAGDVRMAGV